MARGVLKVSRLASDGEEGHELGFAETACIEFGSVVGHHAHRKGEPGGRDESASEGGVEK